MMKKNSKRTCRQMSQEIKEKISTKMCGRKLSAETKKKISDGMRKAWARIPQTMNNDSININNYEDENQH